MKLFEPFSHPKADPCRRSHFSQSLADDFRICIWRPERDGVEGGESLFGNDNLQTFYMIQNHMVVHLFTYGKN